MRKNYDYGEYYIEATSTLLEESVSLHSYLCIGNNGLGVISVYTFFGVSFVT